MWLDTFDSSHEAARMYDTASWRFGCPIADMNFPEIKTREDVEMLAPPLVLTTLKKKHQHHCQQHHIAIAKADELELSQWRWDLLKTWRWSSTSLPQERRRGRDKGPRTVGRRRSSRRSRPVHQLSTTMMTGGLIYSSPAMKVPQTKTAMSSLLVI
jgi:hypothetical protein